MPNSLEPHYPRDDGRRRDRTALRNCPASILHTRLSLHTVILYYNQGCSYACTGLPLFLTCVTKCSFGPHFLLLFYTTRALAVIP